MKIIDGLEEIDIVPWHECEDCSRHSYFSGQSSALTFLQHFATSDLVIDGLRRCLIGEKGHAAVRDFRSDAKVLAQIAQMVVTRELHVTRTLIPFRMVQTRSSQGVGSQPQQSEPAPAPSVAAGPPPPPPDEPTFLPNIDAAAIAAAQREAAQSGVPFCEE